MKIDFKHTLSVILPAVIIISLSAGTSVGSRIPNPGGAADSAFRVRTDRPADSAWEPVQSESSPDTRTFRFINRDLSNSFFDTVMPFITEFENFRIIVLLIWSGLVIFGGSRGRWAALALIPIVVLSDQISSALMKPLFHRLRPCEVLGGVHFWNDDLGWITTPAEVTRVYKSSLSFPSGHAANITASLIFLGLVYRKTLVPLALIAALVSFSRIYTGVHWPLDTAAGILLGLLIAFPAYFLFRRYAPADREE